jgi:hypothetical protein
MQQIKLISELPMQPIGEEDQVKLLLSKRDNSVQRVEDLEWMMAEFDPNSS